MLQSLPAVQAVLATQLGRGVDALEEVDAMAVFEPVWTLVGALVLAGGVAAPLGSGVLAKDTRTGDVLRILSRNYQAALTEVRDFVVC